MTVPTLGLPTDAVLDLIDNEIERLTRILRRWPTGAWADICRLERDHQLEMRLELMRRPL